MCRGRSLRHGRVDPQADALGDGRALPRAGLGEDHLEARRSPWRSMTSIARTLLSISTSRRSSSCPSCDGPAAPASDVEVVRRTESTLERPPALAAPAPPRTRASRRSAVSASAGSSAHGSASRAPIAAFCLRRFKVGLPTPFDAYSLRAKPQATTEPAMPRVRTSSVSACDAAIRPKTASRQVGGAGAERDQAAHRPAGVAGGAGGDKEERDFEDSARAASNDQSEGDCERQNGREDEFEGERRGRRSRCHSRFGAPVAAGRARVWRLVHLVRRVCGMGARCEDAQSVGRPRSSPVSMPEGQQHPPPLRYRRFGGGYRREDVEVALAELSMTLRQLDNDLATLRSRNRELEGELSSARSEIESLRAKEQELSQTMAGVLRRGNEIEDGASARAQRDHRAGRGGGDPRPQRGEQPDRGLERSVQRVAAQKDNLLDAMRTVIGDFDLAISRVAHGGVSSRPPKRRIRSGSGPVDPARGAGAVGAVSRPPRSRRSSRLPPAGARVGLPLSVRPRRPAPIEPTPEPRAPSLRPPAADPRPPRRRPPAADGVCRRTSRCSRPGSNSTSGPSPTSPRCPRSSARSRTCRRSRTCTSAGWSATAR